MAGLLLDEVQEHTFERRRIRFVNDGYSMSRMARTRTCAEASSRRSG